MNRWDRVSKQSMEYGGKDMNHSRERPCTKRHLHLCTGQREWHRFWHARWGQCPWHNVLMWRLSTGWGEGFQLCRWQKGWRRMCAWGGMGWRLMVGKVEVKWWGRMWVVGGLVVLWVGRVWLWCARMVVVWWVGMDVKWWVVVVRGVGMYSLSSSVGLGVGILAFLFFWMGSTSIFLLSLEFSCLSASISSALCFLRSASSCCILACPSRIATKFKLLLASMLGLASSSFEIPTLLHVETILH